MKVAVLSDIHGNHVALERCMREIRRRDIGTLIFLGDYLGELAYPQKTMKLLYELRQKYTCYFIRGNKEDYWIDREYDHETEWKDGDSTTGALLYAYERLLPEDLEFYKGMSHMEKIAFEGLPVIAAYHGSHDKNSTKLKLNKNNSHMLFEDTEESLILCGHTHIRDEIVRGDRVLLNPGSVGVPLGSHGMSQFLVLSGEDGRWDYEFVRLSYDRERVIRELREEGLYEKAPFWTIITEDVLRHGDVPHGRVLGRAMALMYEETGNCCWPNIPEKYWKRAVNDLIRHKKPCYFR